MAVPGFGDRPERALAGLPAVLAVVDVSEFDEAGLQSLLSDVRVIQRCLDCLVIAIGIRANQLAAGGHGAGTEETIRGRGAVGSRQARRESGRAATAQQVDGLGDAVSRGETTAEHVDAITRHTAKLSQQQRASFDFADLIEKSKHMTPDAFDRLVKRRVDHALNDHGLRDTKTKQAASEFRHWFDHNSGMGRFAGALDPERYEALTNAIEQHMTAMAAATDRPTALTKNLAAKALVELVTAPGDRDTRAKLPYVTVVVDHDTIVHGPHAKSVRQTTNGHDIAPESITRLCCDAVIRRVLLDEHGVPINVGRKHRTATDAQWTALKAIHSTCAWDGCDRPINWCQAHHITEWEHQGHTNLDNLIPLCSKHHHQVHEGHWQIKLLPNRTLKTYKPNGTHHTTTPTPQRI